MREIKYKVAYKTEERLDTEKEGWIVSEAFKLTDLDPVQGGITQFDFSDGSYLGTDDVDWDIELIWLEWTGFKDRSGKEIYEGDVLIRPAAGVNVYFYVKYNKKEARFEAEMKKIDGYVQLLYSIKGSSWYNFARNSQVIGNVWESPELLEGGEKKWKRNLKE